MEWVYIVVHMISRLNDLMLKRKSSKHFLNSIKISIRTFSYTIVFPSLIPSTLSLLALAMGSYLETTLEIEKFWQSMKEVEKQSLAFRRTQRRSTQWAILDPHFGRSMFIPRSHTFLLHLSHDLLSYGMFENFRPLGNLISMNEKNYPIVRSVFMNMSIRSL